MPSAWQRASSRASGSLGADAAADGAAARCRRRAEMHSGRDDRRRDGHETQRAADAPMSSEPAAHQWNICAEPG